MNFRSVTDLNNAIRCWIPELPEDLDLIVGIPRSGLLAASLLALHLNLPLADVTGLCEGRVLATGHRFGRDSSFDFSKRNNILVLDDSINSGTQMTEVKARVEAAKLAHHIYYAAVYASPQGHRYVDYWHEVVDNPRCFEWNVMHHSILTHSCVDIDGVLCRDPTSEENDDGERYQQFLVNVKPLVVPTKPIGWLVTCRLEKYREPTEEWLRRHGIDYHQLVMMDFPDKDSRIASGSHAKFKAEIYKSANADLFIESSFEQAREIVPLSSKPVFCIETGQMINPNVLADYYSHGKKLAGEVISNPGAVPAKLLRFPKRKLGALWYKFLARIRKRKRS